MALVTVAALGVAAVEPSPASAAHGKDRKVRHVLYVGNNWGGPPT